jgi:Xaa-Pro aminopeptidase
VLATRRAGLAERVRQSAADPNDVALLVTSPENVRYLTGLSSSNAAVLMGMGDWFLATDGRYVEAARERAAQAAGLGAVLSVLAAGEVVARLVEVVREQGVGTILVEERHLTLATARQTRRPADASPLRLLDGTALLAASRAVKTPAEVAAVEQACALATAAFRDVVLDGGAGGLLRSTERAVASALESRMLALGAEAVAFPTIVAAGANGARPHHQPTSHRIDRGELVTVDFGAVVDGYASDCTRTVLVGEEVATWQAEVYEAVKLAQQAGVAAAVPGVAAAAVDAAARQTLDALGLGGAFTHGTGHGVGLQVHEAPMVTGASDDRIVTGSVITVEPGVYLPGLGGVRIEDTLAVDDGGRTLTDLPHELLVL